MRKALKIVFITLAAIALGLWIFGPYEDISPPPNHVEIGEDLEQYLKESEAQYSDITPDTQKQILWAGEASQKTPLALVYIHGFSATNYEIRPVPQRLANALSANLYLSRLKGHGRSGEALGEATAQDWLADMDEALQIGQRLGDKTVLITVSSGGTLAALASMDENLRSKIDGIVFMSPNFEINNPLAPLLTWPAARYWVPLIGGRERSWEAENAEQEKYWTTTYPSKVVFPLAALVKEARKNDYSTTEIPALFYYDPADQVVVSSTTDEIAAHWGADVEVFHPNLNETDDAYHHVLAGDILSPDQTPTAYDMILDWIKRNVD